MHILSMHMGAFIVFSLGYWRLQMSVGDGSCYSFEYWGRFLLLFYINALRIISCNNVRSS